MPAEPRSPLYILIALAVSGCAAVEPVASTDLPCIPSSTMCSGVLAMAVCGDDGLRWNRVACGSDEVCLSALPGAGCELREGSARSLGENLSATVRLVLPEGGYCSAFFVNDTDVVTNNHCCPDTTSCVGGIVQTEYRSSDSAITAEYTVRSVVTTSLELDFAVLRTDAPPEARYPHVIFAAESD